MSRACATSPRAASSRSRAATGSSRVRGEGVEADVPVRRSANTALGPPVLDLRPARAPGAGDHGGPRRADRPVLGGRRDVRARIGRVRLDPGRHRPARRVHRARPAAGGRGAGDAGGVRARRRRRRAQQLALRPGRRGPVRLGGRGRADRLRRGAAGRPARCSAPGPTIRCRSWQRPTRGSTSSCWPRSSAAWSARARTRGRLSPIVGAGAPARRRGHQEPGRLHAPRGLAAHRGDPLLGRTAAGQARPARLGDRVRRRRLGDPLHADPAHGRRRPATPSGT